MKLLLEIQEGKAQFVLEMLKHFKFIKTQEITPEKSAVLSQIREAVDEMNSIVNGEKEATGFDEFLDEL